jgi:hypothetical protein
MTARDNMAKMIPTGEVTGSSRVISELAASQVM